LHRDWFSQKSFLLSILTARVAAEIVIDDSFTYTIIEDQATRDGLDNLKMDMSDAITLADIDAKTTTASYTNLVVQNYNAFNSKTKNTPMCKLIVSDNTGKQMTLTAFEPTRSYLIRLAQQHLECDDPSAHVPFWLAELRNARYSETERYGGQLVLDELSCLSFSRFSDEDKVGVIKTLRANCCIKICFAQISNGFLVND
jgi:hypothetical protein